MYILENFGDSETIWSAKLRRCIKSLVMDRDLPMIRLSAYFDTSVSRIWSSGVCSFHGFVESCHIVSGICVSKYDGIHNFVRMADFDFSYLLRKGVLKVAARKRSISGAELVMWCISRVCLASRAGGRRLGGSLAISLYLFRSEFPSWSSLSSFYT